jgi:hypothetical protein
MARSDFIKNELASEYASRAAYASLHSSAPGTTGSGELSITREPITWVSAGGGKIQSQPLEFLVPAGTNLTDVGMWTAVSGGTYVDSVVHIAEFPTERSYKIVLTYVQP